MSASCWNEYSAWQTDLNFIQRRMTIASSFRAWNVSSVAVNRMVYRSRQHGSQSQGGWAGPGFPSTIWLNPNGTNPDFSKLPPARSSSGQVRLRNSGNSRTMFVHSWLCTVSEGNP